MSDTIEWDHIADLYDSYVHADFDIDFFIKEAANTSGEVLELMAGTGRVSLPLLQAGARLTCVDSSSAMLARLRTKLAQQGLSAEIFQMDVRNLALHKQFGLVIIPFHSFGEITSPADQRQALLSIYEHLSEDGRFICTLHNPQKRLQTVDGQLRLYGTYPIAARQSTLMFYRYATYDATNRIVHSLQFYEEYDTNGIMREKRYLEANFSLLQKAEFESMALSAGFKIAALYGDYSYEPFQDEISPYMIWVLKK